MEMKKGVEITALVEVVRVKNGVPTRIKMIGHDYILLHPTHNREGRRKGDK